MKIEDIIEFERNAIEILKKNSQYATAKAVEIAFNALVTAGQIMWERDIAVGQLKELGISFGQEIDGVYLSKKEYAKLLEYKHMYDRLCK